MDGVDTGVLISDFTLHLRRENVDVPDIYFSLLVRQDLFDRTVNPKGMKTKDSQETVKAFSSMITKKNRPKKIWVDKGTEFATAYKKFCAAEAIEFTLL